MYMTPILLDLQLLKLLVKESGQALSARELQEKLALDSPDQLTKFLEQMHAQGLIYREEERAGATDAAAGDGAPSDGDDVRASFHQLVAAVKAADAELQRELARVEADLAKEEELHQQHIVDLHRYNEAKDAGQLILGRIAEFERTTTVAQYEKFGLDKDD